MKKRNKEDSPCGETHILFVYNLLYLCSLWFDRHFFFSFTFITRYSWTRMLPVVTGLASFSWFEFLGLPFPVWWSCGSYPLVLNYFSFPALFVVPCPLIVLSDFTWLCLPSSVLVRVPLPFLCLSPDPFSTLPMFFEIYTAHLSPLLYTKPPIMHAAHIWVCQRVVRHI